MQTPLFLQSAVYAIAIDAISKSHRNCSIKRADFSSLSSDFTISRIQITATRHQSAFKASLLRLGTIKSAHMLIHEGAYFMDSVHLDTSGSAALSWANINIQAPIRA